MCHPPVLGLIFSKAVFYWLYFGALRIGGVLGIQYGDECLKVSGVLFIDQNISPSPT